MAVTTNQEKITADSQPTGSWGRFARRLRFTHSLRQDENRTNDTIWFYVAISAVYFLLIGLVLLILLLAPKFRSSVHPTVPNPNIPIDIEAASGEASQFTPSDDQSVDFTVTESKDTLFELPKDPIYYDIDPRSPIFRGSIHKWEENNNGKERANSKFLQH